MSVNRVTSGDPSRGNMSIDTTADLQVGQVVQVRKIYKGLYPLTYNEIVHEAEID